MCGGAFSGAVTLMGLQRLIKVFAVRASEEGKRRNNMGRNASVLIIQVSNNPFPLLMYENIMDIEQVMDAELS